MTTQKKQRLQVQDTYLQGVTLIYQPWRPSDPQNDHDHCEFCRDKFAVYDGCLHESYCTEDHYRWVCEMCFRDLKERFQWRVKE